MIDPDIAIGPGSAEQVLWEDSWVVGIGVSDRPRTLTLFVELALAEDHPHYSGKRPGEARCYRVARVEFLDYAILGPRPLKLDLSLGPDGEADFGALLGIRRAGPDGFEVDLGNMSDPLLVRASRISIGFEAEERDEDPTREPL